MDSDGGRDLGSLDVPEVVVGDGVEDLVLQRLLERVLVGLLEVHGEAIALLLLEDAQLLVHGNVELLERVGRIFLLELVDESVPLLGLQLLAVVLLSALVDLLELGAQLLLVSELEAAEVLVGELEDQRALVVLLAVSKGLEHLLHDGALGVLGGARAQFEGLGGLLVLLEALHVLVVVLLVVLQVEDVLGLIGDVVGHEHVVVPHLVLEVLALLDVFGDLRLHGSELQVSGVGPVPPGLDSEQEVETDSVVPVAEELVHLLPLVEGDAHELVAPPGRVGLRELVHFRQIWVVYDVLVVEVLLEAPDVLLVDSVVHSWGVGVGGRRESRLSVHVEEHGLGVGVAGGD
mmetsp:Transcript_17828/g.30237  ORF Transcript_17828/g.30237 Transcript_17828/m.30237 type:complete len:347 (-) Transcript_17828:603-1643(-)